MIRALAGAFIAAVITAGARRTGTLSESGQWAAFACGILATAAGWWWAVSLIAFFVTSSALTRWREDVKRARTDRILPRPQARNARQVLANGGLFAALALASRYTGQERLAFAALGALTAATADTWSTELGTLFGGTPRLITSGRLVEPGMSGGVTLVGFAAGFGGALVLAAIGSWVLPSHHARLAEAAFVAGFGGCLFDSLLGATVQSKRFCDRCREWSERRVHPCGFRTRHARGLDWMTNDTVNFGATLAGAALAVIALRVLPP